MLSGSSRSSPFSSWFGICETGFVLDPFNSFNIKMASAHKPVTLNGVPKSSSWVTSRFLVHYIAEPSLRIVCFRAPSLRWGNSTLISKLPTLSVVYQSLELLRCLIITQWRLIIRKIMWYNDVGVDARWSDIGRQNQLICSDLWTKRQIYETFNLNLIYAFLNYTVSVYCPGIWGHIQSW